MRACVCVRERACVRVDEKRLLAKQADQVIDKCFNSGETEARMNDARCKRGGGTRRRRQLTELTSGASEAVSTQAPVSAYTSTVVGARGTAGS